MSVEHVEARHGAYADSVTLMQVSAAARAVAGVDAVLVAMGTELNLGLAASMGFTPPAAGLNDLVVAVRASGDAALAAALAVIAEGLDARPRPSGDASAAQLPLTVTSAVRAAGPGLALISVPGQHAFGPAIEALDAGCDVMIFSDNVPVGQEVALKDIAGERGLLVMGPDCGTAVIGGIGLGFSHSVAAGPVGLVAASGTGAQQLLCLLDAAGAGVSAAIGVGGRDLSAEVGGRSARAALAALDADSGTELIVVLSKPPAPHVAAELRSYARGLATPVQFALIGPGQPDLTAAAESVLRALGTPVPRWPRWLPPGGTAPDPVAASDGQGPVPAGDDLDRLPGAPAAAGPPGALRGLFAGGTLCDEAMVIASERLGPVLSNIPLRPDWQLDPHCPASGHAMIDFGDDALTAGRPHPMIDQSLRLERLAAEAADPATAVILLDVVLGYGAHPDPAAELGPAIAAARAARGAPVVVSLIGAHSDPQGLAGQAAALAGAGAQVFASNAEAARFACDLIGAGS